jgi:GNAT superfamily N-acetyltransferase
VQQALEDSLTIRRARPEDDAAVRSLAASALGWDDDERMERFFDWKHRQNPFGSSPAWLAEVDGAVVGFRTFMRWRFRGPHGAAVDVVRAVDTATHPDHQGRGIFTALTLHAIRELAEDGTAFVFNTPNGQSRPGYLKMGWTVVGRVPVAAMARSPRGALRMASARVAADRFATTTSGEAPETAFADDEALSELLATQPRPTGLATERSGEFYRWRYGLDVLGYRVLSAGSDLREGFVVFRTRRRGGALECTICDVVVPGGEARARRRLVRQLRRTGDADYVLAAGDGPFGSLPLLCVPRLGPVLTWRGIDGGWFQPPRMHLTMGDIEIF